MIASVRKDLEEVCAAMEHLTASLSRLVLEEKVDVGARVRAIKRASELLDDVIKEDIVKRLKGVDGTVPGELFKAVRASHDVTRLDQKRFEAERPRIYKLFLNTKPEARITYQPR